MRICSEQRAPNATSDQQPGSVTRRVLAEGSFRCPPAATHTATRNPLSPHPHTHTGAALHEGVPAMVRSRAVFLGSAASGCIPCLSECDVALHPPKKGGVDTLRKHKKKIQGSLKLTQLCGSHWTPADKRHQRDAGTLRWRPAEPPTWLWSQVTARYLPGDGSYRCGRNGIRLARGLTCCLRCVHVCWCVCVYV